jgi:hypothetical protein
MHRGTRQPNPLLLPVCLSFGLSVAIKSDRVSAAVSAMLLDRCFVPSDRRSRCPRSASQNDDPSANVAAAIGIFYQGQTFIFMMAMDAWRVARFRPRGGESGRWIRMLWNVAMTGRGGLRDLIAALRHTLRDPLGERNRGADVEGEDVADASRKPTAPRTRRSLAVPVAWAVDGGGMVIRSAAEHPVLPVQQRLRRCSSAPVKRLRPEPGGTAPRCTGASRHSSGSADGQSAPTAVQHVNAGAEFRAVPWLALGASAQRSDVDGVGPIHMAALRGHGEVIRQLVAAGANVSAPTRVDGSTPLHLASGQGHEAAVRVLVRIGRPAIRLEKPPCSGRPGKVRRRQPSAPPQWGVLTP